MNKSIVFSSSDESDDDEQVCPICYGIMDETDLRLFPCPCNFQICIWCLDKLANDKKPCPNCRLPYDKENYRIVGIESSDDSEDDNSLSSYSDSCDTDERGEHCNRSHLTKSQSRSSGVASELNLSTIPPEILQMRMIRIIQRNLVYLVGFPVEDMDEEFLRSQTMFGQYGNMLKVVMSKNEQSTHHNQSAVLYLTFEKEEDARRCIIAVDGYNYKGSTLKASYGTTKYCNSFIYGTSCTNKNCLYLHTEANPSDCFSREKMTPNDEHFYKLTHPGNGSVWDPVHHCFVYRRRIRPQNTEKNGQGLPPPPPILQPPNEQLPPLRLHPAKWIPCNKPTELVFEFGLPQTSTDLQFDSRNSNLSPQRPSLHPSTTLLPTIDPESITFGFPEVITPPSSCCQPIGLEIDLDDLFRTVRK